MIAIIFGSARSDGNTFQTVQDVRKNGSMNI